tara:strand:- start:153 stop:368 length:216 start_codon:yes stop_codon:yes gene_type:complete
MELTLAGFEATLGLVNHIDAAAATNNAVVTVAGLKRTKRVTDLHDTSHLSGVRGGSRQTRTADLCHVKAAL